MKYEVIKREGSHKLHNNVDAALVEAELSALCEVNGILLPEDVVSAAEDEDSALHAHFQWDDERAAHMHRLEQARKLITSVDIRRVRDDRADDDGNIRAWVHVTRVNPDGETERGYVPTLKAMTDEETRSLVLKQALHDLNALQRRYSTLTELSAVFSAIDEVKEAVEVEVLAG